MAGTERRLIDTALLLGIGGAYVYVNAKLYQRAYYGYFRLPSDLQPAISSRDAALLTLQAVVLPLAVYALASLRDWVLQEDASPESRVRWLGNALALYLFVGIAIFIPGIYRTWSWRFLFEGAFFAAAAIMAGLLLAQEPWARRAASSPYALVVPWTLVVLLTASPRGTAAAMARTDFYTLPSQPKVVLISPSADNLVGVYLKSKNKLGTKFFVLKLEGGQVVTLVRKHLGRLHH
jgi:hypothetical protein